MPPVYKHLIQCLFSEFIGTAFMMFAGCMGHWEAVQFTNTNFQISLNMALVVMIVVQCFGHISGAHVNPVVTVAAFTNDVIKFHMLLVYFIGQFFGAIAGFGLLVAVSSPMHDKFCMTLPNGNITQLQVFVVEFIVTSMLVVVCCAVWDSRNVKHQDSLPVRLGLTVGCLIFSAVNLSGGSMNPVRSFGPALWLLNFDYQWIYWVAPLSSSVISSLIYKYCFRTNPRTDFRMSIDSE
ncbi:aquaporin AQPcic-like [Lucilia sericata]|uniref:aquaporin AQPcic-like n=1 Tax=Lucilia sericata TaxID=13632 RepID=UPI0018A842BD|nr:aquaporin AQPcic-like [Lucilia sericata]